MTRKQKRNPKRKSRTPRVRLYSDRELREISSRIDIRTSVNADTRNQELDYLYSVFGLFPYSRPLSAPVYSTPLYNALPHAR